MAPVWAGDVAPLSDYIDQSEMEQWLNIGENEFDGKIWAAPIYVVGQPLAYNKELFRRPVSIPSRRSRLSTSCWRPARR